MKNILVAIAFLVTSMVVLAGDKHDDEREPSAAPWQVLFDGSSLESWRGYHEPPVPHGWRIEGETLHFSGGQGDIITREAWSSFELSLEWKVSEGGNSGIFYRAALGQDVIYMSAPEMQVLDDAKHRDGGDPLTSAGAVYGLYPTPRGVVKPAGEWNDVRIRVEGQHVRHWLNGELIADYELGSPEWTEKVAGSKFADWPAYGQAAAGHIGLQDHGDPVWFRNIRILPLDP